MCFLEHFIYGWCILAPNQQHSRFAKQGRKHMYFDTYYLLDNFLTYVFCFFFFLRFFQKKKQYEFFLVIAKKSGSSIFSGFKSQSKYFSTSEVEKKQKKQVEKKQLKFQKLNSRQELRFSKIMSFSDSSLSAPIDQIFYANHQKCELAMEGGQHLEGHRQ